MPNYSIRTQGDMDGACFLYALANAAQAITGLEIKTTSWSTMIENLKNPRDYLDQHCGTLNSDHIVIEQEKIANRILYDLSPSITLTAKLITPLRKSNNLKENITKDSVVVLSDSQHWYCVVDVDASNLYIACSWQLHEKKRTHLEKETADCKRKYNRVDSLNDLRVFKSRGFVVTKE